MAETIARGRPDERFDLAAWDALGETEERLELVEGVLELSPSPTPRHQRILQNLVTAFADALGDGWAVLGPVDVVLVGDPRPTVRAPDVVVLPESMVATATRADASDVLAIAEVVSPGSRRTDRVAKLAEYARAGIEHHVVVDPGPPLTVTEFRRPVDGAYERVPHPGDGPVRLAFGPEIDPVTLLRR